VAVSNSVGNRVRSYVVICYLYIKDRNSQPDDINVGVLYSIVLVISKYIFLKVKTTVVFLAPWITSNMSE
jgi:hypothetical protein